MILKQVGNEILKMETIKVDGAEAVTMGTHYCFTRKLAIESSLESIRLDAEGNIISPTAFVNEILPLRVRLLDWQGGQVKDDVTVTLLAEDSESTLELVDGGGDFDFLSEVPGEFTIIARYPFCDDGKLVVTVDE